MLRGPDGVQKIEAAAAGYMADTAQTLGLESVDQLSTEQVRALDLGRLAANAARAVVETRQLLEINEKAANALFGSFIPAVIGARAAAHDIALTQGQFTPIDEASLTQAGAGLENIGEYLAPFKLQSDAALSPEIPTIGISTILRLKGMGGSGKDGYLSAFSSVYSMVDYNTEWPSFSANFNVPVLVDPKIYTVEEFAGMPAESADGYAEQVRDTWRSILEAERDHPSFTGQPLVIRAVAVLPVPPAETSGKSEFAVDFLPQISKSQADVDKGSKRAYDVRLLVKGDKNLGGNYIKFEFGNNQQAIFANSGGKRAPLTVERGRTISEGLPESTEDLGLTPRSQGAIALYIAPHVVKEREPAPLPSIPDYGSGGMFGTRGETMKGGLGAASVGIGPASTWATSVKRPEGLFDRVAPELQGRPIIMSIQLLTFEH